MQNERCEEGTEIVNQNIGNIENLFDRVFKDIQSHLITHARIVNPPRMCELQLLKPPYTAFLTGMERIIELDGDEIPINFPRKRHQNISGLRAFVDSNDGRIYLHRGNWCIKSVYHEMLHLCSRTSSPIPQDRAMGAKHRYLFEGITELLTGCVLNRTYQQAYHNCWLGDGLHLCKMTYPHEAALWATFCSVVPLRQLFEIYFHDGIKNLSEVTEDFEKRVRSSVLPDFSNPFDDSNISGVDILKNQCISILGVDEFQTRYERNLKHINFDDILL